MLMHLWTPQLVELFGGTRDEWMKKDIDEWLNMNSFYHGTPELLQHAVGSHETYIVTTKQVSQLLSGCMTLA